MFSLTYLSPTAVFSYLIPSLSNALYKPKLDITVVTIVSLDNSPCSFKYLPQT